MFDFGNPDAERTMATFLGSSSKLTVDDIDEDLIQKSKIVYLEGYLTLQKQKRPLSMQPF